MLELLRGRADALCSQGLNLIQRYSDTHPANGPDSQVVLISSRGSHFWDELPLEGKALQAEILPEIDRFTMLVSTLTQGLPSTIQDDLAEKLAIIRGAIDQGNSTWWDSKARAQADLRSAFCSVVDTLEIYFNRSSGDVLVIPDTNALLRNPNIEEWRFEGIGHFTIVLVPAILSELDFHKINHKNEAVRIKAETLIRKFKEYRRRGSLHSGISIVKRQISLRAIASEPVLNKSCLWFDSSNADDRFLATVIELIRANLSTMCFIVTDDINMLNKADYVSIPSLDVPGPV